jgi:hypothetical protein
MARRKKDKKMLRATYATGIGTDPRIWTSCATGCTGGKAKIWTCSPWLATRSNTKWGDLASQTEECEAVSRFIFDCAARGYIVASFAFDREDLDLTLTPEGLDALRRLIAATEKE